MSGFLLDSGNDLNSITSLLKILNKKSSDELKIIAFLFDLLKICIILYSVNKS
jgi:hypothetical protein